LLDRLRWVDLGGGYLLQDVDDMGPLHEAVQRMRARGLVVIMEPGSAIVAAAGYLVGSVVDVFDAQGQQIAVLDTSINHAPEVFEYAWSPDVVGAEHAREDEVGEGVHLVTGSTCLAGDVFGRYRFPAPLEIGARVVFTDLGAYSFVKAHRFNGVNLPTVYALHHGEPVVIREFTFTDFVSHYGGTDASV
jgi:carboxynorspermidine decarboxylase